jgi:cupin fold WbuC family metalloprotein
VRTKTRSPEVLVATEQIVRLTAADLAVVENAAINNARKRARLCAHMGHSDPLHEMLICLARDTYVRPHRHKGKSESFHMIAGELHVVLFHTDGTLREVIQMGPHSSGSVFFYRLMEPCFHTVLVKTPRALFHETTNGPFDPADTEFAAWSPSEDDAASAAFIDNLRRACEAPLSDSSPA